MKKQALITIAITLFLASSLFINPGNAATQTSYTLQSSGTIQSNVDEPIITEANFSVLLRGYIPAGNNLTQAITDYIGNYTFAKNMIIVLGDFHIDGILQYPTKYNSSSLVRWGDMQWTFNQTKKAIDTFHSYGWTVLWGGSGIAWEEQYMQEYISTLHPELGFTDADGYTANNAITNGTGNGTPKGNIEGNKTVGHNCLIPNIFARYASDDKLLNISKNSRLIDVIASKLGDMVSDGLSFDGWYPTDGWNGWNMKGYNFPNSKSTTSYSFSYQEENEWGSDIVSGFGLPSIGKPSGWNSWNITQRADWIMNNETASETWHEWWAYKFSKAYLQIKNAIASNNPNGSATIYIGADTSCLWNSGNLGGQGLINFTMIANDQSIDRWIVDPEVTTSEIPRYDAYTAALVKSKDVRLNPIIGLQESAWADGNKAVSESNLKAQYLAQIQNYVWFEGNRYRAADITCFALQYTVQPPSGQGAYWATSQWNNTAVHRFFDWAENVFSEMSSVTPVYLGPTVINPVATDGWAGNPIVSGGFDYIFAQWADAYITTKNSDYITSGMGTIILDQTSLYINPLLHSQQELVCSLYDQGELNVVITMLGGSNSPSARISSMFKSGNETLVESTFGGLSYAPGTSNTATILTGLKGTSAWITNEYSGISWHTNLGGNWRGTYKASNLSYNSTYSPIARFADGTEAIGINENSNGGRFFYMTNWNSGMYLGYIQYVPSKIVNQGLSWTSYSPINSTQPLMQCTVFQKNSKTVIPVLNLEDSNDTSTISGVWDLTILAKEIGLGSPADYLIYWLSSSSNKSTLANWNNIQVSLNSGADVLIIERR